VSGKNLTRDEAVARAGLLSVAAYDVALDLTTGPTHFRTRSSVEFTATQDGAGTFIDLIAASVEQVTLNGSSLDPVTHFDGVRVQLPALRSGVNTLTVDATGAYMNTGEGLHRFVDPVDNEVYLYTQFEVADCAGCSPSSSSPTSRPPSRSPSPPRRTGRSSPTSRHPTP